MYYGQRQIDTGIIDRDDQSGFGPEVVSYREGTQDVYVNGTFDVDVHYFDARGNGASNFTLDVILNETEGANRRVLRFESTVGLEQTTRGAGAGVGQPADATRFNDVVKVSCSSERICSLASFDNTKLSQASNEAR